MIRKLRWDKREGAFLVFLKLIKNSGHVIDIGANIGVMTYHFAHKLPNAMVHSFEPNPENFQVLSRIKHKFRLNNVFLYNYALGNKNGETTILMPQTGGVYFHGLSHVIQDGNEEKGKVYTVSIKRLDDFEEFLQKQVSAIKIDVENYEYEVLLGAEKVISKNKPLVYCELWPGENRQKCFEYMLKNNYSAYVWNKNELVLYNQSSQQQNFFFIPTDKIKDLNLI
ncbi:MAG: FkbM family methyltransferase [Bacteroidales bacterium]